MGNDHNRQGPDAGGRKCDLALVFSLANAMNSAIDFAGDELGVAIKRGKVQTIVTGARSLIACLQRRLQRNTNWAD